jgi:hypothetical protein
VQQVERLRRETHVGLAVQQLASPQIDNSPQRSPASDFLAKNLRKT